MQCSLRNTADDDGSNKEGGDDHDITIIHISDTHIAAADDRGARPQRDYDSRATFDLLCQRIADSGLRPDLIAVTGDICDAEHGERARQAYRHVGERLAAVGGRIGCPVAYSMGNHDERAAFRDVLLMQPALPGNATLSSGAKLSDETASSGDATPPMHAVSPGIVNTSPRTDRTDRTDIADTAALRGLRSDSRRSRPMEIRPSHPDDRVDYSFRLPTRAGELRVIVLDSSMPGRNDGSLSAQQLNWLARLLGDSAPAGSVLLMHHPPVRPYQFEARQWELDAASSANLAAVVRGSDVRAMLCGHVHLASAATFAGVPVSIAGACSRNQDPFWSRATTHSWDANHSVNLVLLRSTGHGTESLITPAPLAGGDSSAASSPNLPPKR